MSLPKAGGSHRLVLHTWRLLLWSFVLLVPLALSNGYAARIALAQSVTGTTGGATVSVAGGLSKAEQCRRLARALGFLWQKYYRCFEVEREQALYGGDDCRRSRADALMAMSGSDHVRLELYTGRAKNLGCPNP